MPEGSGFSCLLDFRNLDPTPWRINILYGYAA